MAFETDLSALTSYPIRGWLNPIDESDSLIGHPSQQDSSRLRPGKSSLLPKPTPSELAPQFVPQPAGRGLQNHAVVSFFPSLFLLSFHLENLAALCGFMTL